MNKSITKIQDRDKLRKRLANGTYEYIYIDKEDGSWFNKFSNERYPEKVLLDKRNYSTGDEEYAEKVIRKSELNINGIELSIPFPREIDRKWNSIIAGDRE